MDLPAGAKWSCHLSNTAKKFSIPLPIMGVYYSYARLALMILSGLLHQASLGDRTVERKDPPLEMESASIERTRPKIQVWETVRSCQRAGRPTFGGVRDTLLACLKETLFSDPSRKKTRVKGHIVSLTTRQSWSTG